ncbi:hypothetical protein J437_LFUL004774 [Ladona fulva]|uniref:LON peptidase N-terminal domain and RING finger protein 1 n=1 Tax=Ladona fulva TaxID=123851 RepID=A0A8K0NV87_LADFU|nr:hypothetical protein J437_LFUL004774 [Ladona fulva]
MAPMMLLCKIPVKGHYRRGVALYSLGHYEDALMAFCTCVALDGNTHALRHEVSQVLYRIMLPSGLSTRGSPQSSSPVAHHRLSPNLYPSSYPHSYSPPYSLSSPIRRSVSQRYHLNHSSCPPSPPNPLIPSVEVSANPTSRSLPTTMVTQPSSPLPQLSSLNQLGLHSSDCEDNSSGEEDSVHTPSYHRYSLSSENARLQGMLDKLLREMEKIKRGDKVNSSISSPTLLSSPPRRSIDPSEFDCVLCCRTLWSPVTTPCGHTYCWVCLDRCLDYSCACPLCKASLADYLATSPRSVTEFIEKALWTYLPEEYEARQIIHKQELSEGGTGNCIGGAVGPEGMRIEPRVPVFVCTAAFPNVPCPLFVYEPRYRLMVRRCVETGGRQFGIAACISSSRRSDGLSRYADYGTMLEMQDWVLMGDGCSLLSTIGVRRFRVIARGERDGYDTAQVQFIQDQQIPPEQVNGVKQLHDRVRLKSQQWLSTVDHSIRREIERTFGRMPELEPDDSWLSTPDGPAWAWWVLAILPLGQNLQVGVLAATSLEKRLRAIDKTLDRMERSIPSPGSQNMQGESVQRDTVISVSQSSTEQDPLSVITSEGNSSAESQS